jgi:hypothetical protein
MYDARVGRWTAEDLAGFAPGGVNLYRYAGNDPANARDPSGLWEWRLGPEGQVLAVSEPDDTVDDLIKQGYAKDKITGLAAKAEIKDTGAKLKAGQTLDLSGFFPKAIQEILRRQQNLPDTDKDLQGFLTRSGAKEIPKGKTLGTSGIDLMQTLEESDSGRIVKTPISGYPFGWGNCYGFVGLFLGVEPPKDIAPQNVGVGSLRDEKEIAGFGSDELPEKPTVLYSKEMAGGKSGYVYPEGGLWSLLTKGREKTNAPNFGAIAVFQLDDKKGVRHAAIVLGRSQKGDVYVLQKLNQACPCTVSKATHPLLKGYGDPTYYQAK